jgi:uncharacterized protein with GYD domain
MWFVALIKLKNPPSKERAQAANARMAEAEKLGIKFHTAFHTLGRYDAVSVFEAPDEKAAMKYSMSGREGEVVETLVAVARDEVVGWMK